MAYISKRTGQEVDALLDKIENGDIDITIDTELSKTSNNAIANSTVTRELERKMANTPSGDPMHYIYEEVGAKWNANTMFWELNDIYDITTAEMRSIYAERYASRGAKVWDSYFRGSQNRTNLVSCKWHSAGSLQESMTGCYNMVIISLGEGRVTAIPNNILNLFRSCSKLRKVVSPINMLYCTTTTDAFGGCSALEYVTISNLKTSISFANSPLLSKESLLYMIDNCASNATFTITIHPDVWEKCDEEWLEDIDSALGRADSDKQTNITLARA